MKPKTRKIINPMLIVSGILTMVTGLLMLFHFQSHPVVVVHELMGIGLVAVTLVHLALNWRPMIGSLGRRGRWVVALIVTGTAAIMIISGVTDPAGHINHRSLERSRQRSSPAPRRAEAAPVPRGPEQGK